MGVSVAAFRLVITVVIDNLPEDILIFQQKVKKAVNQKGVLYIKHTYMFVNSTKIVFFLPYPSYL